MYNNPLYNPNINPYINAGYNTNLYQQQPKQEVIKVNGENGARAFPLGANSSAILLDESGMLIWLITSDGAGYKTVTPYDISPHQAAPTPDYSTLEQRIERLEGIIHANTSDTTTARNEAKYEFSADKRANEHSKSGSEPTYSASSSNK